MSQGEKKTLQQEVAQALDITTTALEDASPKPAPEPEPDERKPEPVHPRREAMKPSAQPVHEEYEDIKWVPPMTLDAPPPRPGFAQRWIRAQVGPDRDIKNWSRKMREGWSPRDPSTLPPDFQGLPKGKVMHGNGTSASTIMIEGMVLCELPIARKRARDEYFQGKTQALMDAVKTDLNKVERQGGIRIRAAVRSYGKTGPHAAMPDREPDDSNV